MKYSTKTLEEMHRVVFNDYVDATLAAVFVAVVLTMALYGLIESRKALRNPKVTAIEVDRGGAIAEASHA
jgi:carbon starvation protein